MLFLGGKYDKFVDKPYALLTVYTLYVDRYSWICYYKGTAP